jgi:predicted transposase/invertase (TIGR01784 family)
LEIPKFTKTLEELETRYDKWLFLLSNLPKLDKMPTQFKEKVFEKLFKVAKIANYDEQEQYDYQDSLKYYRDLKNVINTAVEEAIENTKDNVKIEIAQNAILKGLDNQLIVELTNLDIATIEKIRTSLKK